MELIEGSENQRWICDLCDRDSAVGEKVQAWRCSQDKRSGGGCNFDICTLCIGEYKVYYVHHEICQYFDSAGRNSFVIRWLSKQTMTFNFSDDAEEGTFRG